MFDFNDFTKILILKIALTFVKNKKNSIPISSGTTLTPLRALHIVVVIPGYLFLSLSSSFGRPRGILLIRVG